MGQQRVKDMTETPNKASQEEAMVGAGKGRGKKAAKRQIPTGRAYIRATYNNTLITFTDANGNALVQYSAGQAGFKGPKKSTPYAAGIIVSNAAGKVRDYGLKEVNVFVKGVGGG